MELQKYINKNAIIATELGVFKAKILFVRENIVSVRLLADINQQFKRRQIVRVKLSEINEIEVFNYSNKPIYKFTR